MAIASSMICYGQRVSRRDLVGRDQLPYVHNETYSWIVRESVRRWCRVGHGPCINHLNRVDLGGLRGGTWASWARVAITSAHELEIVKTLGTGEIKWGMACNRSWEKILEDFHGGACRYGAMVRWILVQLCFLFGSSVSIHACGLFFSGVKESTIVATRV
jgi:hypothetical protein